MAEVKILVKGYVSGDDNNISCSTITLVRDKDKEKNKNINIIVDPGTLKDRQILINALKNEGLKTEDINWVCITHSHMDHYRNIGMFSNAKALDYWGIWEKDTLAEWNCHFTSDIEIIKTPGHNYDGISLLVKTKRGIVAVVGDVFWKEEFPKEDPYATDKKKLEQSRKLIKGKADFIVPGHGEIFKVKRKQAKTIGEVENGIKNTPVN